MPSASKAFHESFRWRLAAVEDDGRLFPDEAFLERHVGVGEYRGLEFFQVNARRVLNEVPHAPYGFRWTVNAYRGCSHACTYCFARPTHAYLGFDMGDDFDSKIVVKVNAAERLRAELRHPRWRGELVAMGTNTDPYQRAEGRYHLTRHLVGVLAEAANPFSLLTKSPLILRDLQLLTEAAAQTEVRVNLSIGTLDAGVWRLTEPGAPHPARRMDAVAQLNAAGVSCGVLMGPVLPGLSDGSDQLAAVVEGAVAAGATSISAGYLHLRGPLREHVLGWAQRERPDLAEQWQRLYAGRATVPAALQRRLSRRVAALVVEARQGRNRLGRSVGHLLSQPHATAAVPSAGVAGRAPPLAPLAHGPPDSGEPEARESVSHALPPDGTTAAAVGRQRRVTTGGSRSAAASAAAAGGAVSAPGAASAVARRRAKPGSPHQLALPLAGPDA